MGFTTSRISPKFVIFLGSLNWSIIKSSCTPVAKKIWVIIHRDARTNFSLPTTRSHISLVKNWPTSNSYPSMSPTINVARTGLTTLFLVVGHSLCQPEVHHALASKFIICLEIYYDCTFWPWTTQLTFFLFNAIKPTIHKKCLILSFDPIGFFINFRIFSM